MNHEDKERLIIEWRIAVTLKLIGDYNTCEVKGILNELEPEIIKSATNTTKGD